MIEGTIELMEMNTKTKITEALDTQLQARGKNEMLDIIIELPPNTSGEATIPEMRSSFDQDIKPVDAALPHYGGEIIASNWLNRTLCVKIPAANVPELSVLPEIFRLDTSDRIERE